MRNDYAVSELRAERLQAFDKLLETKFPGKFERHWKM